MNKAIKFGFRRRKDAPRTHGNAFPLTATNAVVPRAAVRGQRLDMSTQGEYTKSKICALKCQRFQCLKATIPNPATPTIALTPNNLSRQLSCSFGSMQALKRTPSRLTPRAAQAPGSRLLKRMKTSNAWFVEKVCMEIGNSTKVEFNDIRRTCFVTQGNRAAKNEKEADPGPAASTAACAPSTLEAHWPISPLGNRMKRCADRADQQGIQVGTPSSPFW